MEKKLTKEQLTNILNMLSLKKTMLESVVKDYEVQINGVRQALEEFDKKPTESMKS